MKHLYPTLRPVTTKSRLKFNALSRRAIAAIFLLFAGLFTHAQTTPVNGTTAFSGVAVWGYTEYARTSNATAGFTATNVQGSGWDISGYTSGPDDYIIAGENWGGSSDGTFVYLALNSGSNFINSMRFKPNDGKLFDLNTIDMGYDAASNTSFTITGYRGGVAVTGASFIVTSFANFGLGGSWRRGINIAGANSNFKGIDEFRITPNTASVLYALDIDNINATNFRTGNFAQIIPSDIPLSKEGAFTKTISGHSFTFTPAADDYIDYNNDVGTGEFGGLYAYDYNTADGTEETITPPSGYSFDLSSFQYISDRGLIDLTVTLTFKDNSTDTKSYTLNGNSAVQTFNGFTTAPNDIKSIRLVTDALIYSNNFEVSDIKSMGTLPLHWLQFTAAEHDEAILLNWTTAAEQGTKDFQVQHSADGRQWQTIGSLMAAGNASGEQAYSFLHGTPANGLNAYRLLQRDIDGRSNYSPVVTVNLKAKNQFTVYPNPAVNGAVQVKLNAPAVVYVFNGVGTLVMQKQLPEGVTALNLDGLAKGMYTLKANNSSVSLLLQ